MDWLFTEACGDLMLRRFWVDPNCVQGLKVLFKDESFHHLIRVSRKKSGDKVEVLNGQGKAFSVEVTEVGKKTAEGKILGERALPAPKPPFIHLAFCFPKPAHFELVLEKSVELGAASLRPLINDYSQVQKLEDFPQNKRVRWEKIVKSATEQSGRGELMPIEPAQTLQDFVAEINQSPKTLCLFLYEGECPLDVRGFLQKQDLTGIKDVWALVGSEGGFSEKEVILLKSKGFQPLSMGQQILRTETACVSILSVLKYEFGLMR